MPSIRQFKQSPWEMGEDEKIAFGFDTTPWGVTCPLSPSAVIKNNTTGSDLSSTMFTGSAAISTCTATCVMTPRIQSVVSGSRYRLEVKFTDNNSTPNTFEAYGFIDGAS